MAHGMIGQIPGLDDGNARVFEQSSARAACGGRQSRRWPRAAAQQLLDQPLFLVDVIVGVAEQDLQAAFLQAFREASDGIGKVGIVDRGNGDGDEIRALRAQVRRRAVEDIAEAIGGFEDAAAGRVADGSVPLEGLLTVMGETPARRATSAMVGVFRGVLMRICYRYLSWKSSVAAEASQGFVFVSGGHVVMNFPREEASENGLGGRPGFGAHGACESGVYTRQVGVVDGEDHRIFRCALIPAFGEGDADGEGAGNCRHFGRISAMTAARKASVCPSWILPSNNA